MICSVEDCTRPIHRIKHQLCRAHYRRWQRHGDPTAGTTYDGAPAHWLETVAFVYEGSECLLWPFSAPQGYGEYKPTNGAHRAVCIEAHGPPPTPDHEAAHSCDNKPCCAKLHLRWATRAENVADRYEHAGVDMRPDRVREQRRLYMRAWRARHRATKT